MNRARQIAVRKGIGMDYRRFSIRDPQVCGGEPVIAGTRVTIRTILASLAEGARIGEILSDFPALTEEQVMAVIAFAAASAEEDISSRCAHQKRRPFYWRKRVKNTEKWESPSKR